MKGALFHHDFQTAFVDAAVALTKFGVLAPSPREGKPGTWQGPHKLTMDADEMPDFLADSVSNDDDRLFGLLEAFLAVFCEYDYLPDRHTPFTPPDYLGAAMNMLARNGYAERRGDQFVWTEPVRPAMQAAYLWDPNGISYEDVAEQKREAEAQLAWQTMPETLRESILSGKINLPMLIKILRVGWQDEQWRGFKLDDPGKLRPDWLTLGRRIFELAHARPSQKS